MVWTKSIPLKRLALRSCPDVGRILLSFESCTRGLLLFNVTNSQHMPHLPARAIVLRDAPALQ